MQTHARTTRILIGSALGSLMTLFSVEAGSSPMVDDLTRLAAERERQVARLESYAARGAFPVNTDFPGRRVPYFIDDYGTPCAVGHLIQASGHGRLAQTIAAANNHIRIMEITDGPALDWIRASGLTQRECALIQPAYGFIDRLPVQKPTEVVDDEKRLRAHFTTVSAALRKEQLAALTTVVQLAEPSYRTHFARVRPADGAEATSRLLARLRHKDPDVRVGAALVLARLHENGADGGEMAAALSGALDNARDRERFWHAFVLEAVGDPDLEIMTRTVGVYESLLAGDDTDLHWLGVARLEAVGMRALETNAALFDRILDRLTSARFDDAEVNARAASAAEKLLARKAARSPKPGLGAGGPPGAERDHRVMRRAIETKVFHIERVYPSMQGMGQSQTLTLLPDQEGERVWIRGVRVDVIGADDRHLCHVNVDLAPDRSSGRTASRRLFTLSQGQSALRFPPGFGVPVRSDEILTVDSQAYNPREEHIGASLRYRTSFEFVRDRDLTEPMKPLFSTLATTLKEVSAMGPEGVHGCHAAGSSEPLLTDAMGRRFTWHWQLAPGQEVLRTRVSRQLRIPYDTTLHFAGVHLHAYAKSIELIDITRDVSIWKAETRHSDAMEVEHMDLLSSANGVPLYRDHEYELVSVYDNTTDTTRDAMATMFLYLLDKDEIVR